MSCAHTRTLLPALLRRQTTLTGRIFTAGEHRYMRVGRNLGGAPAGCAAAPAALHQYSLVGGMLLAAFSVATAALLVALAMCPSRSVTRNRARAPGEAATRTDPVIA